MGRRGLWTGKHLRAISRELAQLGLRICPNTVRRLLGQLDYALHANRKSLCANSSPHRDQQFRYLNSHRQQFSRSGYPIISVDTKKKELVGQFKNNGQVWSQERVLVQDHDFRSQAQGLAIPYGIYDVQANRGMVVVGTSHDTPLFAVEALCRWRCEAPQCYPDAYSNESGHPFRVSSCVSASAAIKWSLINATDPSSERTARRVTRI